MNGIQPMRRVYYFTPPDHALENLQHERLKVSRFSQCNDAFELAAFNLRNAELRRRFNQWLNHTDQTAGLICFCRSWKNPVLWGHYARNHTGLCYGFDVDPETFVDVRYVSERLYPGLSIENFEHHVGEGQMTDLFATKFIHWAYEEEVRLLVTFSEKVSHGEVVFHPFSNQMKLREVIVGPRSKLKVDDVLPLVQGKNVDVFKSRLAFQKFEVVRQKDRRYW